MYFCNSVLVDRTPVEQQRDEQRGGGARHGVAQLRHQLLAPTPPVSALAHEPNHNKVMLSKARGSAKPTFPSTMACVALMRCELPANMQRDTLSYCSDHMLGKITWYSCALLQLASAASAPAASLPLRAGAAASPSSSSELWPPG